MADSSNAAADLTVSSVIQNGTVTKTGAGTMVLSGANTYGGATSISAGAVNYQNGTAFGGNSAITVASGATAQVQGGITGGSSALKISGSGATGSTGALENVSGNNSYAGLVTLGSASTISSDTAGNSLALTNTGTITGSGYGLTLTGSGDGSVAGVIGTGGRYGHEGWLGYLDALGRQYLHGCHNGERRRPFGDGQHVRHERGDGGRSQRRLEHGNLERYGHDQRCGGDPLHQQQRRSSRPGREHVGEYGCRRQADDQRQSEHRGWHRSRYRLVLFRRER